MKLLQLLNIKKSIHSRIFLSFILVTMLPSAMIGIGSYFLSVNILTQKVSSSFSETVFYVRSSVEKELYQIKKISAYIYIDMDLKEAIQKKYLEPSSSIEAEKRVREKLKNYLIAATFNNINAIKVYGFNGFEMSFGENGKLLELDDNKIINSPWYNQALQINAMTLWAGIHESFLKERGTTPQYSISLFRVIKDKYYKQNIGIMYISLDPQIFSSLTKNLSLSSKNEIYILDNNNRIVNNPTPKVSAEEISKILDEDNNTNTMDNFVKEDKSKRRKYFFCLINDFNWKIVGMVPIDEVTRDNIEIFNITAAAFVVSFIFSCVIWFFVSSSIIEPVKRLTQATRSLRNGDLDVQVQYSSSNELGVLTSNFNYMVKRINDLLKEVLDENIRKKDAEYKALQAQINPHFLYNTLNSIRWMAGIQKADNIKNVVDALERLLRNSTSKMDQYITIKEELDNLNDYIYIQKIAYKNKFHVEYDVSEEVLQYKCIKFILQPLVENAVFHGIQPKDYRGTIWVSINKQGDYIHFSVKDNGVGMSNEEIEKLLSSENETIKKFNGIGINNIHERIQMTYNGQGTFAIDSRQGEYTNIIIKVPIIE